MRDHRSLEAWKDAKALSKITLRIAKDPWRPHASGLFTQLQRAALSIQLNIAEGYALGSRKKFTFHLSVAYGSAVETGELLELGLEEKLLPEEYVTDALERCRRCERLLLGLIKRYRLPA